MSRKAIAHLRNADPVMADLIARVGPYRLARRTAGSHFAFVARAIIYQQLSTKAAGTIHGRFEALFPASTPDAIALLAMPDEAIRGAGISRQKLGYLRDLATRVSASEIPVDTLDTLPDDAVIEALTAVKGVGRWTAQMFLMFRLGRLDVLPDADLGIQKAIKLAYRMRAMPSPERVRKVGARWQPYRTVACWYLWRSLDIAAGATM